MHKGNTSYFMNDILLLYFRKSSVIFYRINWGTFRKANTPTIYFLKKASSKFICNPLNYYFFKLFVKMVYFVVI